MRARQDGSTTLQAVSNALVKLHKEQFGRGPRHSHASFADDDTLVCVLEDVLLPAEAKMVELGELTRVRESRIAFQAATEAEFVAAVEQIVYRKVRAFASGLDPTANTAFECFQFEPREAGDTNGGPAAGDPARRVRDLTS